MNIRSQAFGIFSISALLLNIPLSASAETFEPLFTSTSNFYPTSTYTPPSTFGTTTSTTKAPVTTTTTSTSTTTTTTIKIKSPPKVDCQSGLIDSNSLTDSEVTLAKKFFDTKIASLLSKSGATLLSAKQNTSSLENQCIHKIIVAPPSGKIGTADMSTLKVKLCREAGARECKEISLNRDGMALISTSRSKIANENSFRVTMAAQTLGTEKVAIPHALSPKLECPPILGTPPTNTSAVINDYTANTIRPMLLAKYDFDFTKQPPSNARGVRSAGQTVALDFPCSNISGGVSLTWPNLASRTGTLFYGSNGALLSKATLHIGAISGGTSTNTSGQVPNQVLTGVETTNGQEVRSSLVSHLMWALEADDVHAIAGDGITLNAKVQDSKENLSEAVAWVLEQGATGEPQWKHLPDVTVKVAGTATTKSHRDTPGTEVSAAFFDESTPNPVINLNSISYLFNIDSRTSAQCIDISMESSEECRGGRSVTAKLQTQIYLKIKNSPLVAAQTGKPYRFINMGLFVMPVSLRPDSEGNYSKRVCGMPGTSQISLPRNNGSENCSLEISESNAEPKSLREEPEPNPKIDGWGRLVYNFEQAPFSADGQARMVNINVKFANTDANASLDVNGDGQSDLVVWRPSAQVGETNVVQSNFITATVAPGADESASALPSILTPNADAEVSPWGLSSGFVPLPPVRYKDKMWFSVVDTAHNIWYGRPVTDQSKQSALDTHNAFTAQWGLPGDIHLTGNLFGDYNDELVVWRPSNGTWYTRTIDGGFDPSGATHETSQLGLPGDTPLLGNVDGDAYQDKVIYREIPGGVSKWFIKLSNGQSAPNGIFEFEIDFCLSGDKPLLADITGDGRDDLVCVRKNEAGTGFSYWYVRDSSKPWEEPSAEKGTRIACGIDGLDSYFHIDVKSEDGSSYSIPAVSRLKAGSTEQMELILCKPNKDGTVNYVSRAFGKKGDYMPGFGKM